MTAKERYDLKRRGIAERLVKERARGAVRYAEAKGLLVKTMTCSACFKSAKTVWHHSDYAAPLLVLELCYACHRKAHPRPMPNGKVI